ncbi:MAG: translation initiation factor IF-5A [Candidatus Woesearchaeota archaeon]
MDVKIVTANSVKKGNTILIDNAPCRVVEVNVSKPGKHGSAKVRITAIGLLDDKKRDLVLPAHDKVEVPIIEKKVAQVLSVSGEYANVMDNETYETFDLKIPEDLKDKIQVGMNIEYWSFMGTRIMRDVFGNEE